MRHSLSLVPFTMILHFPSHRVPIPGADAALLPGPESMAPPLICFHRKQPKRLDQAVGLRLFNVL
jgi:hypothetical protein